jgi:hypothetical protein
MQRHGMVDEVRSLREFVATCSALHCGGGGAGHGAGLMSSARGKLLLLPLGLSSPLVPDCDKNCCGCHCGCRALRRHVRHCCWCRRDRTGIEPVPIPVTLMDAMRVSSAQPSGMLQYRVARARRRTRACTGAPEQQRAGRDMLRMWTQHVGQHFSKGQGC